MKQPYQHALHTAFINLVINLMLAALKGTAGLLADSTALLSDAVHSLADVLSTVAVMVGIGLSGKGADERHPYGRERMECVAAVVLSFVVAASGAGIALTAIGAFDRVQYSPPTADRMAWIAAVTAIVVKEGMFRYTRRAAKQCGSSALMADAWHQRTDALSSLGSLVGLVGVQMGMPLLDPLAGLLIALLIIKAAVEIFVDSMRKMTDRACNRSLEQQLRGCIEDISEVEHICGMQTRLFGSRVLVEVTVQVAGGMSAKEAYGVARRVEETVEKRFEEVKACSVHIRPAEIPPAPLQNP